MVAANGLAGLYAHPWLCTQHGALLLTQSMLVQYRTLLQPLPCGFANKTISSRVCKHHAELGQACRYISEVYGGLALHPVDLMDAGTGRQLAALTGADMQVSAVGQSAHRDHHLRCRWVSTVTATLEEPMASRSCHMRAPCLLHATSVARQHVVRTDMVMPM